VQKPLAGKSTLNRLELGTDGEDLYKRITVDEEAVNRFFVEMYLSTHPEEPEQVIPVCSAEVFEYRCCPGSRRRSQTDRL